MNLSCNFLAGDGKPSKTATGSSDTPRSTASLFAASVAETLGLTASAAQTCEKGVEVWAIGAFGLAKCCEHVKSWLQDAQTLEQNGRSRNVNEMEKQVSKLEKQVAAAHLRAAQAENHRQNAVSVHAQDTAELDTLRAKVSQFLDFESRYKAHIAQSDSMVDTYARKVASLESRLQQQGADGAEQQSQARLLIQQKIDAAVAAAGELFVCS